jgi:hypothetical protein
MVMAILVVRWWLWCGFMCGKPGICGTLFWILLLLGAGGLVRDGAIQDGVVEAGYAGRGS